MAFQAALSQDLLRLILLGEPIPGLAMNVTADALTNYYLSLHLEDPGPGGNQTTNEIDYLGYGRKLIVRGPTGWTVNGSVATPVNTLEYNAMAAGGGPGGTVKWVGLGTALSGVGGRLLFRGPVNPHIPVEVGTALRVRNTSAINFLSAS